MDADIRKLMQDFRAFLCLDCGKCTANCPVARHADFSPRLTIARLSAMDRDAFFALPDLGECLTCGMCAERCPSDVRFTYLVKRLRQLGRPQGWQPACAHAGALQASMRLAARPERPPERLGWVTGDLRTAEKGDVLYFTGCLPQFDIYFDDLDLDLTGIARSAVRLLNRLGIEPALLPDEPCCGHDLLWSGDREGFLALARRLAEAVKAAGAETVVCTCAECFYTLKYDVPAAIGRLDFDVVHMAEFLRHRDLPVPDRPRHSVTYHDPCRLGRLAGIYREPRNVLDRVADLREMEHAGHAALCCGTTLWANCNAASMAVQKRRLAEAEATGADRLITACPKCLIHFACAQKKDASGAVPRVPVQDLTRCVAEALEEEDD